MSFKMINVIMISLLVCFTNVYSQELTEEEKQKTIQSIEYWMYDSIISANHSSYAIKCVIKNQITEAIPHLIDNLWSQTPIDQYWSLYALSILKSSDTEVLTLEYIDSLDHYYNNLEFTDLDSIMHYHYKNTNPFSISELKLKAIKILFKLNNYSHSNFIFESRDDELNIDANSEFLSEILKKVPNYSLLAENELKRIAEFSELENFRFFSGSFLAETENCNEFVFDWLRNKYVNESERSVIIDILTDFNPTQIVNSFLKTQLIDEESELVKIKILDQLIRKFGNPKDYKYLIDNVDHEPSDRVVYWYNYYINHPISLPDSQITIPIMLDILSTYTNQCNNYEWLKDENYKDELVTKLTNAKNYLNAVDSSTCRAEIASFQNSVNLVYQDSTGSFPKYVSIEGYKFLYHYAQYILERLPEGEEYPYLKVSFKDSQGNLILDGLLKYYDAGWKDATNNGDGTFNVETEREKVSLRIQYAGTSQDVANIDAQNNTYTFTTINTKVQFQDNQSNLLDGGTVKYYAAGWKDFGESLNGEVTKELLPKEYSFRMSYGGTILDKKQNIGTDPVVVFQTASAKVQLQDSQGNLLDGGAVKYYAAGWKDFGEALDGEVTKELLPKEYSFRMSYGGASLDKKQNIETVPLIVFSTVNSIIRVVDGSNQPINSALTSYYASGWKQIGNTINGEITKELLPNEYSFRVNSSGVNQDIKQDINSNNIVEFTFE